jgi:hypothetical protein
MGDGVKEGPVRLSEDAEAVLSPPISAKASSPASWGPLSAQHNCGAVAGPCWPHIPAVLRVPSLPELSICALVTGV